MSVEHIKTFLIYILSFILVMNGMSSLNYEKFIKKNKVVQAQLLFILVAMGLAYLVAKFLEGLLLR